jgi:hypothetical protein
LFNQHEAGRLIALEAKVRAAMIPPSPMQLTMFGSALYGELCFGLCRALAAPWLDPGWLIRVAERAGPRQAGPGVSPPVAAVRQERTDGCALAPPPPSKPRAGQVIEVPPARWQGRRKRSKDCAAER